MHRKSFPSSGLFFGKVPPQHSGLGESHHQQDGTFYMGKVRSRHEMESGGAVCEQPVTSTTVSVQPGGGSWWGRRTGR